MGKDSKISWTHHTFNPWHGCTRIEGSPACGPAPGEEGARCYAEAWSERVGFSETGSHFPIWGAHATRRFFGDKHWNEPLKWNREAEKRNERHRVFCGSMCDVMEDRTDLATHRMRLFALIESTPQLDWLLLTKRPQNYRKMLPAEWSARPRHNVWLMTTVESQEFTWRIDELLQVPAVVHGISYEPAVGSLDLRDYLGHHLGCDGEAYPCSICGSRGRLSWVIAGGESGHGARAAHPEWFRDLRDDCVASAVAFLFKQWGENNADLVRIGRAKSGSLLDGKEWKQFPFVRVVA